MLINRIAFCLIILLSLFAIYCSIIIGMSWDDPWHHIGGALRLDYLKSFGQFNKFGGGILQYYPGLYDTFSFVIVDFFLKIFPGQVIEIKHLINLIFSFLTLMGLFLLSKKIFNKEVANLATLICFINPFFFGHMSMNPKDNIISFALVWFVYSTYMYCINFEKKRLSFLVLASFFMGFGLGIRVSFFAITIPIILSAVIFLILKSKKNKNYLSFKKMSFDILVFVLISFSLMIVAWPHVHNDYHVFLETIFKSIQWESGPNLELINGNIYETANTPKTYFLSFFIFRMPIFVLILLSALIFFLKRDNKFFISNFHNFKNKITIIFFIIVFPILLAIILQVKLYNGIRLFLFIIPFLSLLISFCFYYIIKNLKKSASIKILLSAIVIFFLLFLQRFIYLTPYHYDYSNFFNIRFANTEKLYIHDYWATSYKELMKLISANTNLKKVKADYCGGDRHGVKYLANKYSSKKVNFVPYEQADYIIMINTLSIDANNKSSCYSMRPGKDIVVVDRLGVKLSVLRKLEK